MTWEAYEATVEDSGAEARQREKMALSIGIDRLEQLAKGGFTTEELVGGLLYVRRLWAILIEDLSHPENALPEQLRADIISIGVWVIKEADRLREERSCDVVKLVEINRVIRDALS